MEPHSQQRLSSALRAGPARSTRIRTRRRALIGWSFLAPAFLLILIFHLIPAAYAIILSFTEHDSISAPEFIGLANFGALMKDRLFINAMKNTLFYLLVTPVLLVVSLLVAVLVNRRLLGVNLFRVAYYLPVVTPAVATAIVWSFIFRSPNGLLNQFLQQLPFVTAPIHFLTSSTLALPSVMSVEMWKGIGYYMVIFLSGLQAIPSELRDAAVVDGANPVQEFFYITLPQLWPSITFVAIVSSMAALRAFDLPYIMTGGGPGHASETMVMRIYTEAFERLNIGYAAAEGVVLFLITLGISYLNMRMLERRDMT